MQTLFNEPIIDVEAELLGSVDGTDLDDADRLLFSDAGLSATRVEGLKFKVTASADDDFLG